MCRPRADHRALAALALALAYAAGCTASADTDDRAGMPRGDAADVPPEPARDGTAGAPDAPREAPADAAGDAAASDGELPDAARPGAGDRPRFRYAIAESHRAKMMVRPVFHVDRDPAEHPEAPALCTNYAGEPFPACYDGHTGSDFMLGGGFATMDAGSAPVVAAAGGVVEVAEDGHYDRCRGNVETLEVTCDGHEMRANFVRLRHANGWSSLYYHLRKGSVAVSVGQRVACGDVLGLVGSSGRSTLPHLHFQVESPDGEVVDPFAPADDPAGSLFVEQAAADGRPGGACDARWASPPDDVSPR
jgi:murein DD-endopeptidase MepM/ murein hydrolase activator NlpD